MVTAIAVPGGDEGVLAKKTPRHAAGRFFHYGAGADARARLAAGNDLRDHARCDGDQQVIATDADPMIATRGRLQIVAAPVVHDILAVAVVARQAAATVAPFTAGATRAALPSARTATVRVHAGAAMHRSRTAVIRTRASVHLTRPAAVATIAVMTLIRALLGINGR